MTNEDLQVDVMRIKYNPLSLKEQKTMNDLKSDAYDLWLMMDDLGSSRELSIAKTKLEEVVMWAVKHITDVNNPY